MKTLTLTLTDQQYDHLVDRADASEMTVEACATWLVIGWGAWHPDGRKMFPNASREKWREANR